MKLNTTVLAALSLALASQVAFAQQAITPSPLNHRSSYESDRRSDMQPRPLPGSYAPERPSDMQPRLLPGTRAPLVDDPSAGLRTPP